MTRGLAALIALALVGGWGPSGSVRAADGPAVTGVEVGIAGCYKLGMWTPVRISLAGGQTPIRAELVATVPDGEGVPSQYVTPEFDLPAAGSVQTVYVRFGRVESEMLVELRPVSDADGPPSPALPSVRRTFRASADRAFSTAAASNRPLFVVVGAETLGLENLGGQDRGDQRPVVATVDRLQALPEHWSGYEAVDAVVLTTDVWTPYASLPVNVSQIQALDAWVRMGGMLVISVGKQAEAALGPQSPIGSFVPGKLERTIPLRQTTALEQFAGGSAQIPRLGLGGRLELRVPQLAGVEGRIEAREGNLPIVVRAPRGFGEVVFVAVDLADPALRAWRDRGLLLRRLLDLPEAAAGQSQDRGAVLHHGYDDISGQLRSALDQFPDAPGVPFSLVAGLIVAYLLLIGPIEYFVLRRLGRRMTLTWIVFPTVVLAFSAAALVLAYRLKGNADRVNQIDLVDVDVPSGLVRGTAWANLYSASPRRYDLAFEPANRAEAFTSWFGLPGSGLGGMEAKTVHPIAWKQPYRVSANRDALAAFPLPAWSTRSLTARWTGRIDSPVHGQLHQEAEIVAGTIVNGLDVPLEDALLCYGHWVLDLGTLEPNETRTVGLRTERRDLRAFVTGQKVVLKEGRQLSTPYDRSSTDVGYILRAMMFFDAAAGRQFTGLDHRYQAFVDASDLLHGGRAVLVGRVPDGAVAGHGAPLAVQSEAGPVEPVRRRAVLYRFVLPVAPAEIAH